LNATGESWMPSSSPAPLEDERGLDLKAALGVVRRNLWLIVASTLLCLGLASIALFSLKPVYTASALVLVDPSQKNLLDPNAQGGSVLISDSPRVDSEVELVKSETTLVNVARAMNLVVDPEFGARLGIMDNLLAFLRIAQPTLPSGDEALRGVIDRLSRAVNIRRVGFTYLISVDATSGRPAFAAELANTIARTYIEIQLRAKQDSLRSIAEVLSQGLDEGRAAVNRSDNDFDVFIAANIVGLGELSGNSNLRSLYLDLQDIKSDSAALSDALAQAETSIVAMDWDSVTQSLESETLAALQRQRQDLLDRLAGVTTNSATDVALRQQLETLNEGFEDAARDAIAERRAMLSRMEEQASEARTRLQSVLVESNLPADMQTRVFEFLQGIQIARTQYEALLSRQKDVTLEIGLQVPDSRLASVATPPSNPSFPNPRVLLSIAALGGLALGLGLAFVIENFVGGFTSEGQLRSVLKIPVIATVPLQRSTKATERSIADTLLLSPLTAFPEAIRRARIGVQQASRRENLSGVAQHHKCMILMVSSASPGEGKTTTSLALARAFAGADVSTLIIDCDLRKPGMYRLLGQQPDLGLIDYLEGRVRGDEIETLMLRDPCGVDVILGSHRADVPTDQLVGGKLFRNLIEAARNKYEVIILDTPPVGPVVDGLHLAAMSDVIVLVVKWSSTPQQEVRATLNALQAAKASKAEVVAILNQQPQRRSNSAYSGYYLPEN
jgi:polysaccharide biosynthesis transport protein